MKKPIWSLIAVLPLLLSCGKSEDPATPAAPAQADYVVLAWNDLGMHCLNPTYDKLVVLPPYNNLWVQVIKRGVEPEIVTAKHLRRVRDRGQHILLRQRELRPVLGQRGEALRNAVRIHKSRARYRAHGERTLGRDGTRR